MFSVRVADPCLTPGKGPSVRIFSRTPVPSEYMQLSLSPRSAPNRHEGIVQCAARKLPTCCHSNPRGNECLEAPLCLAREPAANSVTAGARQPMGRGDVVTCSSFGISSSLIQVSRRECIWFYLSRGHSVSPPPQLIGLARARDLTARVTIGNVLSRD